MARIAECDQPLRVTVTIPHLVILARWRHTIVGELLRDVTQTRAVGIHAVNPLDHRRCCRVGFEAVKPLPKTCLGRVRVGAAIDEPITARRSTTEISVRVLREC
ncbi:hypothetical protein [Mycobacterium marinum]|uniref:hypothetical protein n=1 Tax=Mycobacterium marinum TaxID=1781 RepID=UPI0003586E7C|nr:hypothetical protein [Mycobacterium marinum]EPQ80816.1 hypothetical protein MMEU_1341 [Mycobacterium marinum str. Europe]BBC66362.1 hypothetical protein MMRN_32580 [Mycobacterium marinum]